MCVRVCLCVVSVSCFDRPHRSRDFNLRHRRTPAGNSVPKVNKLETTASGRGEKKPHLRILRAPQDSVAVCVRLRLFYSSQRKEPNVPGSTQHQHSTGLAWCDHSFPRTSPFIFLTAQIDLESGVASGKKKKEKERKNNMHEVWGWAVNALEFTGKCCVFKDASGRGERTSVCGINCCLSGNSLITEC